MSDKNQTERVPVKIKRVSLLRLLWFTKLNTKIHKKDPLFKKALASIWSRLKFTLSFGFRLLRQDRFVLRVGNKIAGALALQRRKKSIFIYAIGVLPSFRRQGYGTMLMRFTEDFALKKNRQFVCFSVLLENQPAVNLYQKLGYHSQGIGLTLIRLLMKKFSTISEPMEKSDNAIRLEPITNPMKKKAKTFHWWNEEIATISRDARELCEVDKLLEFDFHPDWKVYAIISNEEEAGILINLTSSYLPTFVLFSSPTKTWTKQWFLIFLSLIVKQCASQQEEQATETSRGQKQRLFPPSLWQIFLTHQHKEHLMATFGKGFIIPDTTEDRQIYFKKLF